ncbi:MAG: nuclear transport factor 2 family protein [Pseudomonadota bacterium]
MADLPIEISNFFLAMQAGQLGAARLEACFAEDAEYVEPFTGEVRHHRGRAEIMTAMALGWEMPMENTHLRIDRALNDGTQIVVDWTCFSTSLTGGKGQGTNVYDIQDGLITRLITTLRSDET